MAEPPHFPDPAVIVLVGASGTGKSTWAMERFRAVEIVSSDQLRAIVGSGPADQAASLDAFALLDQIVAARIKRQLTAVIDTTGLETDRRRSYLAAARAAQLPAFAVIFEADPVVARQRNATRDRPVPAAVLTAQLRRLDTVKEEVEAEGWDAVLRVGAGRAVLPPVSPVTANSPAPPDEQPAKRLGVVLQISQFPWGEDPAVWLKAMATTAGELGFDGIALMDHLIQIPQVGREWEPIPEPWVTLGFLAGLDTHLRLGTLVSPVTFHAPGVLAKTVATLDVLTGGRAFCGVGAGWWQREHSAFGLDFPPAGERLDRLALTIETLRALWAPGTKAYRGQAVTLPETTCYPRPVARVPILVGGSGERRTLKIAAELADGCNLASDLDTLDSKVAVLHRHCAAAGRNPDEVEITVLDVPVVGRDRDDVAARVERLRGRTAAATFARRHHAGTVMDHVRRYEQLAEHGVGTVFLSLPDLSGPDDLIRCGPLVRAASGG